MPSLVYFVACTLDGFIAAPDGSIDAFVSDPEYLQALFARYPETCPAPLRGPLGVAGGNERFDSVIMGRATYAAGLEAGVPNPYPTLDQYVVSTTLQCAESRVTVVRGELTELVDRLRGGAGRDVWLAGGGRLAAAMRDAGLIDELILKINPVALGDGIPMFDGAHAPVEFDLVGTSTLPAGVQLVHLRRVRGSCG